MEKFEQLQQYIFDIVKLHAPKVLFAIATLIIGLWIINKLSRLLFKAMVKKDVDESLRSFFKSFFSIALKTMLVVSVINMLGIQATSFIAILGAAGLAVGLALKDSLANFASGVMLILFRPFKVGDYVTAGGVSGTVQQIDIFSTILLTVDNQKIIVPNAGITSGVITNVNAEPTRRIDLTVAIGYDDDIRKAKSTLENLVQTDKRILEDPAPTVAVSELADSSVNLVVRPWVETGDYWAVRLDLIEKIKLTFDEKGISFPYPQQDVHMYQKDIE